MGRRGGPRRVGWMPYRAGRAGVSGRRSPGRCRGTRSTSRRGSPVAACSRGPASRPPPGRSCRGPWPAAPDRPAPRRRAPTRGNGATGVGQAPGHRLVAHRVDLELERLAGALACLGRIADVGRLVVGDGHPLRSEDAERRRDDVRALVRGRGRCVGGRGLERHDVDAVPASADAVAAEREAELALDVGRDDRVGLELRGAEPAERGSAGGQTRLLVVAAHEALVRPGRLEDLVELRLAHDVALGVAVVEQLDGLVERRAVDDRVVRGERHAQHVRVLVLERTGQVVVDLVEAQRQRLGDRTVGRDRVRDRRLERRQPLDRRARARAGTRDAGGDRQVERLEDERRDAPRPRAAVVRGVRQDELVACPGHRHVAQPPLLAERGLGRRRLAASETGRERQRFAATVPREAAGDHPGQEDDRELEALGLVDGQDRDRVGVRIELRGRRVVAGLDERREMRRDEDRPVVAEQRRLRPDDLEEPGDVRELLLGGRRVRLDQPGEQAAGAQEPVEQLAGRTLVGLLGVAAQVGDELAAPSRATRARPAGCRAGGRVPRARPRSSDCAGGPC